MTGSAVRFCKAQGVIRALFFRDCRNYKFRIERVFIFIFDSNEYFNFVDE